MNSVLDIRASIKAKIDEDRKKTDALNDEIINVHLVNYLNSKKQQPKNPEQINKKTGKRKKDFWGHTYKRYKCFFDRFVKTYKKFDRASIVEWREDFIKTEKKKATFNNELALLNGFSLYLLEERVVEKKIINTRFIKFKEVVDREHYKTIEDKDLSKFLISNYKPRIMPYIKFAILSGLRAQELVDIPTFRYVENRKKLYVKGKGGKIRVLQLTKVLKQLRKAIIKDPIPNTDVLSKTLKRYMKSQGMPPYTFHCFRATYASTLYERGVSIEVIAKILGHTSVDTSRNYIRALRDDRGVELLDPFNIQGVMSADYAKGYKTYRIKFEGRYLNRLSFQTAHDAYDWLEEEVLSKMSDEQRSEKEDSYDIVFK